MVAKLDRGGVVPSYADGEGAPALALCLPQAPHQLADHGIYHGQVAHLQQCIFSATTPGDPFKN